MKKRTMYSMYHQVSTVGQLGFSVPFLKLEVAPGDTWSGKVGMLLRFSPLKRALLQDLFVDQYVFYVPWRLVWDEWEDFIAAGPNNSATPTVPTIAGPDYALFEALSTGGSLINALYRRGYNLCYNEFLRDELIAPVAADAIPNATGSVGQVGNHRISPKRHWLNELRDAPQTGTTASAEVVAGGTLGVVNADDILRAIAEQKLQMKRATYGTRYVDILRSFGVRVNYQMLQRPEIVATAYGSVNITDVVQTGPGASSSVGQMAGHAISGSRIQIKRKSFPEHGCLLGLMCVRPPFQGRRIRDWMDAPTSYQDYYDPALELLPYQEVPLNRITGAAGGSPGYGPWGQWYRGALSRSHEALTEWVLDHNAQNPGSDFNILRLCTAEFSTDADALFSDTTYGHFQVSAVNGLKALRMISPGNPAIRSGST